MAEWIQVYNRNITTGLRSKTWEFWDMEDTFPDVGFRTQLFEGRVRIPSRMVEMTDDIIQDVLKRNTPTEDDGVAGVLVYELDSDDFDIIWSFLELTYGD